MQFLIEKEAIIDPLSRVSSVIDTGPTIPILSQVLIESIPDGIRLWGSNIDMEASEKIDDVTISEEGRLVCHAQTLLEYCRSQRNGSRLKFEQGERDLIVENIDAKSNEHHNSMTETVLDAEDFPYLKVSEEEWVLQFSMDRFALRDILKRTEHAMGHNEPRMYLNATLLEITNDSVRAVATDGHRMAVSETSLDSKIGDEDMRHRAVLPRKTALELSKVLGTLASRVTVKIKNTHIQISSPHYSFTSKLLEGSFPDWRAAIPGNLELGFRADRNEFVKGFKLVGILGMSHKDSSKGRGAIATNVVVEDGRLDMRADIVQKKVEHMMDVEENQQQHKFQVNYRYFLEALEAMPHCENADIYLRDSHSACQIKFPDDESTSFLIMLLQHK